MHDKNFLDILNIINRIPNFNYWISYGSLLGLIRDGELIEWDDDIDICIRNDKIKNNILDDIADKAASIGFSVIKSGENHQFERPGGRKIDFNVLKPTLVNGEIVLDLVWEIYFVQTKINKRIISKFFREIERFLPEKYVLPWQFLATKSGSYGKLRYRTKSRWVEKTFDFKYGHEVARLPYGYKNLLTSIYGTDWKIPKKSAVWHEFGKDLD